MTKKTKKTKNIKKKRKDRIMYILPLLDLLKHTEKNLSGKHAKKTLLAIENADLHLERTVFLQIRKHILDGYNDMWRDFAEVVEKIEVAE